jgi:hypothetical protein
MTKSHDRVTRKRAPDGVSLAFLALFLQALLPFFVAVEIATFSASANAETAICSHSGAQHEDGADHTNHAACPLCIALSAAQPFTAATPVSLPLPRAMESRALQASSSRRVIITAAAPYQSRAPPTIG